MKFLKWFSLFFVSMVITLFFGICIGFMMEDYFYPNKKEHQSEEKLTVVPKKSVVFEEEPSPEVVAVSGQEERINANTEYICIEHDMVTGEEVPVSGNVPQKYLGMTREQFVESMSEYETNPPLGERERGLVSVEVRRFSSAEVEVLMNYKYIHPGENFYIIVYDDRINVLLEDKKTVFLETGIMAKDLPESLQQKIVQGMYISGEEALYDFLESYTS